MERYVKIKAKGRSMLVNLISEKNGICYGIPVNKDGTDTSTLKKEVLTEHRIMFTSNEIICDMKMNLHYGELEEVK